MWRNSNLNDARPGATRVYRALLGTCLTITTGAEGVDRIDGATGAHRWHGDALADGTPILAGARIPIASLNPDNILASNDNVLKQRNAVKATH